MSYSGAANGGDHPFCGEIGCCTTLCRQLPESGAIRVSMARFAFRDEPPGALLMKCGNSKVLSTARCAWSAGMRCTIAKIHSSASQASAITLIGGVPSRPPRSGLPGLLRHSFPRISRSRPRRFGMPAPCAGPSNRRYLERSHGPGALVALPGSIVADTPRPWQKPQTRWTSFSTGSPKPQTDFGADWLTGSRPPKCAGNPRVGQKAKVEPPKNISRMNKKIVLTWSDDLALSEPFLYVIMPSKL